jgi:two-component system phosphate regulon sensor histidine kinase PhoR
VGLYSRDDPFVFSHYRNRNALVIVGIAFLAGAIVLGAYVLARETAREKQTAALQAELVPNVSHELRTPLTSIRMYVETLLLSATAATSNVSSACRR